MSDADALPDCLDACDFFDNSGVGGLDDQNLDGIPNVCQCGLSQKPPIDGLFGFGDSGDQAACAAVPPAYCDVTIMDTDGDGLFGLGDSGNVGAVAAAAPSHLLRCARRPGRCTGDLSISCLVDADCGVNAPCVGQVGLGG